ncbi:MULTISPECIES: ribosomal protein L7/L12 [Kamptonema]
MNDVEIEPEFDVILSEVPADRILAVIKTIRSITNLPLLEAKNFVN